MRFSHDGLLKSQRTTRKKFFENVSQLWKELTIWETWSIVILSYHICMSCMFVVISEHDDFLIKILFVNLLTNVWNNQVSRLQFSSNLHFYWYTMWKHATVYPLEQKKLTLIGSISLFVPRRKKKIFARGLFVIYLAAKGEYFIKGFFANLKTTLKIYLELLIDVPRAHLNGKNVSENISETYSHREKEIWSREKENRIELRFRLKSSRLTSPSLDRRKIVN